MKVNKLLLLLFAAVVMNGFIWLILVPIWHFPDEQAHFGQVAFVAEKGRNPESKELDLTEEIFTSEKLLGTARDKLGNNKFTFHPEYRIKYTNSYLGKYEASISALSKTEARRKFVHEESSRYPLLYYVPAALIYKLFYASNLFVRIFVVRFWSLFLFVITAYTCFLIGKLLFAKNKLLSLTLPILVGFQPMMVFANVGVNSDALGNFLFTLFLFLSSCLLINKFTLKRFIQLILVIILSVYTKPQFIIMAPVFFVLLFFLALRDVSGKRRYLLLLSVVITSIISTFLLYRFRVGSTGLIGQITENFNAASFLKFTKEYTQSHTYREVLPWYWGIYDWLGVTYPRIVHRIINWTCLFSGIGFVIYLIKAIKNYRSNVIPAKAGIYLYGSRIKSGMTEETRRGTPNDRSSKDRRVQTVIFLVFISLSYFLAISFYDWLSWYTSKYPLGVQGRYFFPLIVVQMLVLLLGWRSLFSSKKSFKRWGVKILAILMVVLNFYALYTVARTYYDVLPLSKFIIQTSQYKPWFLKGLWIIFFFLIYVVTMAIFLIKYIYYSHEEKV